MIEHLDGIHETVNYRENTNIRLYDNTECEEYPPHWHTALEIIMPLHHSYPVTYGDCRCDLQENEILLICPGVLHDMPAAPGERMIFQAEQSALSAMLEIDSLVTSLSPGLLISADTFPEEYGHIRNLMENIFAEYTQSDSLFEVSIYAKLLDLFVTISRSQHTLGRNFQAGSRKQSEYTEKFIDICSFIDAHFAEEITLDMAADRCGFSKYHFTRLFKQYSGISFYKYLNQKRISRAQQMLIDPSLSITDVSLACGYSSLSSFIRMFKLVKGCTPSEFRSLYQAPN